jgi:hypothetical protein
MASGLTGTPLAAAKGGRGDKQEGGAALFGTGSG